MKYCNFAQFCHAYLHHTLIVDISLDFVRGTNLYFQLNEENFWNEIFHYREKSSVEAKPCAQTNKHVCKLKKKFIWQNQKKSFIKSEKKSLAKIIKEISLANNFREKCIAKLDKNLLQSQKLFGKIRETSALKLWYYLFFLFDYFLKKKSC